MVAAVAFSAAATASLLPWMRNRGLVSGPSSFAVFLEVFVPGYSLASRRHGEGYIAKLDGIPDFIDGWVDGLRDGLAAGQTATGRGVANAIAAYDRLLGTEASRDPLAGQSPPTELSDTEADAWHDEVISAVRRSVRPAVARLRDVLHDEMLPGASSDEEPGLCHLPDGDRAYEDLLAGGDVDVTRRRRRPRPRPRRVGPPRRRVPTDRRPRARRRRPGADA